MRREANQSINGEADPAAAAMDSLRRIFRALRAFGATSRRDQRISAAQLFVLRQIRTQPGLSMSELAARTLTTQSAVSEVVGRLVRRGVVTRLAAPGDNRRAQLVLTTVGEELLDHSPETVQERLVAGFRDLPPAQQRDLAVGLGEWLIASGLADVPPSMFLESLRSEEANGTGGEARAATRRPIVADRVDKPQRGAGRSTNDRRDATA